MLFDWAIAVFIRFQYVSYDLNHTFVDKMLQKIGLWNLHYPVIAKRLYEDEFWTKYDLRLPLSYRTLQPKIPLHPQLRATCNFDGHNSQVQPQLF